MINTPNIVRIPAYNNTKMFTTELTINKLIASNKDIIEKIALNTKYAFESENELKTKNEALEKPWNSKIVNIVYMSIANTCLLKIA